MALVGIARLASESPLLEAKRTVQYFEIPTRSILNRTKPNMPFRWTINPYRGCEFGCKYCYARYTHEFMELDPGRGFEERIFAKQDAARLLRRELRQVRRGETIAIGTATDPYQPAERRFGVTRALLEVFAMAHGMRVGITTKSDLVARDADLLVEIARSNEVFVTLTVTTMDTDLARALEPRAPRPDLRIAAVRALAATGVECGVFASPVMPRINDSDESLAMVAEAARAAGAHWFGARTLFLQPVAQKIFFPFLDEQFPHLTAKYRSHFERDPFLRGGYPADLKERVARIVARSGFPGFPKRAAEEAAAEQLALFST